MSFAQRRYYHETGAAILRVDEAYPGAIVEHRLVATGADNLFRAFIAFSDAGGQYAYGSAHEYEPLSEGTFTLYEPPAPDDPDTLQIYEFYDTVAVIDSYMVDTIWVYDTTYNYNLTQSQTHFFFEDTAMGILVDQHITAYYDTTAKFFAEYIFENTGGGTLSNLNVVLFYDGDVPDWGYRDDYPFSIDYLDAVAVRDGSEPGGVCSGFCALHPDTASQLGAWFEWVDTLAESDTTNMVSLLNDEPIWPVESEISPGDWSVYQIWNYGDLAPGEIDTLRIAFIAHDSTGFDSLAAEARGDSVVSAIEEPIASKPERLDITIAPNPFNSYCKITLPEIPGREASLEIFSLDGRIVNQFEIAGKSRNITWQARDDRGIQLPSGVYLVRYVVAGETRSTAKAILIK